MRTYKYIIFEKGIAPGLVPTKVPVTGPHGTYLAIRYLRMADKEAKKESHGTIKGNLDTDFISETSESWTEEETKVFDIYAREVMSIFPKNDKISVKVFKYDYGDYELKINISDPDIPMSAGSIDIDFHTYKNQIYFHGVWLSNEYQGKGYGTSVVMKTVDMGIKNGYKSMDMAADGDSGVYSWARMGFDFSPDHAKEKRDLIQGFKGWMIEKYKTFVDIPINHPWEIANYVLDGKKVGKEYMLGDGYGKYYIATLDLDRYRAWKEEKGIK
jgi:hypothetical protein